MLYVDGMNGVINHSDTIQWLYSLTASRVSVIYFSYKEFHDPWKCLKILEFVLMKIYGFEHPWSWKALTVFTSTYHGYCDQCGYRHPFGNLEISQKFVAFRMFTIIPVHFPFKTTLPTKSQSDHIVVWLLTWLLSKCSTLCHNVTNHLNFFTTHSESQKSVLVVILPSWWPCYM